MSRRFFVDSGSVRSDCLEINNEDDIKHICKVLRHKIGDELDVSDSEKFEYKAEIIAFEPNLIKLRIKDKHRFIGEPQVNITLYQGIPKHAKMDVIIQKSVELGVKTLIPVFTARTIILEKKDHAKKTARWKRISEEAVKQCGRGIIPEVKNSIRFEGMLNELGGYDLVLFPYEEERLTNIKDVLRNSAIDKNSIALIIGPEGGFSKDEADRIIALGGISVSLGKIVLRTETAGPAAIAMIMYELEL